MNNIESGKKRDTWQCDPDTPREKSKRKFTKILGAWKCVAQPAGLIQFIKDFLPFWWSGVSG